jgi:hypothetical protein
MCLDLIIVCFVKIAPFPLKGFKKVPFRGFRGETGYGTVNKNFL